jgi:hypothetical protein
MALSLERAMQPQLRHVVARSRGAMARRLADLCTRHRLDCVVWCITDRCVHAVLRGAAATLASEEIAASRQRFGQCLSTVVNPDLYLLEVARHALLAPVRGGHVRRAIDWPQSSARETYGLQAAPVWLDVTPLYDLLGPRDGRGSERFRRFMESG